MCLRQKGEGGQTAKSTAPTQPAFAQRGPQAKLAGAPRTAPQLKCSRETGDMPSLEPHKQGYKPGLGGSNVTTGTHTNCRDANTPSGYKPTWPEASLRRFPMVSLSCKPTVGATKRGGALEHPKIMAIRRVQCNHLFSSTWNPKALEESLLRFVLSFF